MSDFVNGLQNASDYINRTTIELPTSVTADLNSGTIAATTTGFSLKELICSLLAGNGIKLPNLQICLKINIGRLLGLSGLTDKLRNALSAAEAALDRFIAHTNIDNVLARLNAAIAEFAAIANMINFCGTPVIPRAIPNVLRDIMGSFLGAGKDLLDRLGTMLDQDIGGCIGLGGSFNPDVFTGGLLREIGDYSNNLSSIPGDVLDRIVNDLYAFSTDMQNLIEFENNFSGVDSKGGSVFSPSATRIHTGVGMAFDAQTLTLSDGQRIASDIKGLYDSLSAYEVDEQGNNIFHYLLEPELISKLEKDDAAVFPVQTKEPVYDHCGRIIGYTVSDVQSQSPSSEGSPVETNTQPSVVGLAESGAKVNTSPSATINLADEAVVSVSAIPNSSIGAPGDKKGDIRTDGNYVYISHKDYDGTTPIWTRAQLETW